MHEIFGQGPEKWPVGCYATWLWNSAFIWEPERAQARRVQDTSTSDEDLFALSYVWCQWAKTVWAFSFLVHAHIQQMSCIIDIILYGTKLIKSVFIKHVHIREPDPGQPVLSIWPQTLDNSHWSIGGSICAMILHWDWGVHFTKTRNDFFYLFFASWNRTPPPNTYTRFWKHLVVSLLRKQN